MLHLGKLFPGQAIHMWLNLCLPAKKILLRTSNEMRWTFVWGNAYWGSWREFNIYCDSENCVAGICPHLTCMHNKRLLYRSRGRKWRPAHPHYPMAPQRSASSFSCSPAMLDHGQRGKPPIVREQELLPGKGESLNERGRREGEGKLSAQGLERHHSGSRLPVRRDIGLRKNHSEKMLPVAMHTEVQYRTVQTEKQWYEGQMRCYSRKGT